MLRSNMGMVFGGLAAVAVGIGGGWMLLAGKPVRASAPITTTEPASVRITTASPSPDAADLPARKPAQTATPTPTPPASPARTAEAPPPAPASPTPDAAPADDTKNKPRIHLDGERSEISFDGDRGSLRVNKDRLSVRTPYGKFDLDW